ncbi:biotin--[acetyl-CoA-carboxylase] ligase [Oscillatoria salina]|uniref:biotin--[acetyl-CoA-carboxylase] ligase n=1 Tax=Oscillatoria salina TaxID=331517 RepID=UPI001CCC59E6|nr:biotin--[acetyl-CoA-carboxylase] ligase [Oscillatoria salina]MBZ8181329.1 biotin--[acetyl-CoA-carboxylase] ligase [Oscillatoria salina IIICB1]
MAFDRQKFLTQLHKLSPEGQKYEIPLHNFAKVSSTNQTLWQLLETGATTPRIVIAEQQTAGKGQWGRSWVSEVGGLYISLALSPNIPATNSAHLTIFSAWGVANSLRNYHIPVLIKWSNDLILAGRKLGGILTETRVQQGNINRAVIGVGINWGNLVPDTGISLQSFREDRETILLDSLEDLAAIIVTGILAAFRDYASLGIEKILANYRELLINLGRKVVIDGSPGIIVGVTPKGELRIRLSSQGASTEITRSPGTIQLGYDFSGN